MNYSYTNIVPKESLRKVQLNTLEILASVLSQTAGPRGSNTQLVHGQRHNEYTKDGHNVLSQIKFYRPLENAIQSEMKEITRYIVKTVGDGTTSAVLLSNEIFKSMCNAETQMPAYSIMKIFREIVDEMIVKIRANKKECTLEDIYDICMIATNGNTEVSNSITNIYKQFGMEVFIDVGISNTTDHLVKSYDGLTLDVGYPTPAFINTDGNSKESGKASIRNPRIYAFEDPVDTPEMMSFLETIVFNNILNPVMNQTNDYVPTVILVPSISRDGNNLLTELEKLLYGFDQQNMGNQKPPIMIITNAKIHEEQFNDITMLCGIPTIKKYIDPDIQTKDIEAGKAPSLETICDWYGTADLVEADTTNTKFVNPACMFEIDEEGNRKYSSIYNGLINYISQELDVAYKNNEDANVTGKLKRRLNSLKTNLVEYLIGGVTVTDRDSVRDLVEDAVLNCRSAAKHGVGYGANFEAFRAIDEIIYPRNIVVLDDGYTSLTIKSAIHSAYKSALSNLYCTVYDKKEVNDLIDESLKMGMPLNLATMEFDGKVKCSIETDIAILEAISKVVMVMFTANQALIESPINNVYLEEN